MSSRQRHQQRKRTPRRPSMNLRRRPLPHKVVVGRRRGVRKSSERVGELETSCGFRFMILMHLHGFGVVQDLDSGEERHG